MKKYLCLLALTLMALTAIAREANKVKYPGGRQYLFRVTFSDKHNTPFSLDRPEQFLSRKSIERRKRQRLPVDSTDLPLSPAYVEELATNGLEVVSQSKWNNSVLVRSADQHAHERLNEFAFVKEVRKVWTSPDSISSRPYLQKVRDGINRLDTIFPGHYGVTDMQVEMLGGIRLHNNGYRGQGMTIAVLDGGFMNVDEIPILRRIRLMGTRDFVVPSSKSIYRETDHGTMVLSVMATEEPGLFVGTAPDADYWLVRCEETRFESLAEEDFWARAVEFADSVGADVVSSSLGYHHFDDQTDNYRYSQQDGQTALISRMASMLARKGMVLVNSAGNDGMGTWKRINFPSDALDILSVGAVSEDRCNASFSSVGPTADGRVKPDVMALGSPTSVITGRGSISKDIGTSFSTPLVAGLVACLWQAFPEKSALDIIEMVRQSGSNVVAPDNIMGYGIPNFWHAYQKARREAQQPEKED